MNAPAKYGSENTKIRQHSPSEPITCTDVIRESLPNGDTVYKFQPGFYSLTIAGLQFSGQLNAGDTLTRSGTTYTLRIGGMVVTVENAPVDFTATKVEG